MQTKLAQVHAAMRVGDWPRAFSIASKFARLGSQRPAIMRAQAARLSVRLKMIPFDFKLLRAGG